MLSAHSPALDAVFLALGHPVRRQILSRLAGGAARVTDIARPFDLSLNAISKHLKILERAGLIHRETLGREHFCQLEMAPLEQASGWLAYYLNFLEKSLDSLQDEILTKQNADPGRKGKTSNSTFHG